MDVVIYARYSSDKQTEQSIEGQIAECKKYAEIHNYTIVNQYIDRATTGTNDNREQFLKMIDDSSKGLFNGVLVYQLDRFARNRYDSAINKAKLKKNGVRVLSARENISDDASGILMESVLEGMAEYFSVELGQKTKRGMIINAEKGYYNGGTVPLGFKLVEAEKIERASNKPIIKYKYSIDENTSPIVKKVFNMYIKGESMATIIRYLNNQNIKTSRGNPFNKNSIRRILLDQKYIGTYTYDDVTIKDGISRIIDDNTFERVKEVMEKSKKTRGRARAKAEYLLTTKLFCGHCKNMMVGVSTTKPNGKVYNWYKCKNVIAKCCDKKPIAKDYIEDIVVLKARGELTDENIEYIAQVVHEATEKERNNPNLKRLNKALKDNERAIKNLLIAIEQGQNIDLISPRLSEKNTEKANLEKEIKYEEANCVNVTKTEIKTFLKGLRKGNVNDPKYRKALINTLIHSIYLYDDDTFTIMYNIKGKEHKGKMPDLKEMENYFNGNNLEKVCIKGSEGYQMFIKHLKCFF